MNCHSISLKSLLRRFWKKTLVTWLLVVLEGLCLLLMPLVIGWAVDDLINHNTSGITQTTSFGQIVSIVMYVFGFIESVLTFPLYYQQMIRLHEIAGRIG